MSNTFEFLETEIEGLIEITPFYADDLRGSFIKDYSKEIFEASGICHNILEIFYTVSHAGVIRAMHFQRNRQQPKLVRCLSGKIYDVVLDLRKDSRTFKMWKGFQLTGENKKELLVPVGCAHGYLVLEDAIVSYKCSEKFYAEYDDGIFWKDEELAIHWPLEKIRGEPIVSEKDKSLQSFKDFINRYGSL